ncbi:hypothetical protein LXJ56_25485, partial [Escherichia coli]|nr:hypothetical protein [Escherichia coli]
VSSAVAATAPAAAARPAPIAETPILLRSLSAIPDGVGVVALLRVAGGVGRFAARGLAARGLTAVAAGACSACGLVGVVRARRGVEVAAAGASSVLAAAEAAADLVVARRRGLPSPAVVAGVLRVVLDFRG